MTNSTQRNDKERRVLDCALRLLRENGDAGLTMRKIADCAGMRLSNLQYYFTARDDVLKAMVEMYVSDCTDELRRLGQDVSGAAPRERAHRLILAGLHHGVELSDMCRIFRELWAISSRNDAVQAHMTAYYQQFAVLISDAILGAAVDDAAADRLGSLLVPYFEGYSITAAAMPLPMEEVAEMLTELAMLTIGEAQDDARRPRPSFKD
ncbi:MAG: TetR/AcrR family transcriptional regulator [Pseudomonadota bacterium]